MSNMKISELYEQIKLLEPDEYVSVDGSLIRYPEYLAPKEGTEHVVIELRVGLFHRPSFQNHPSRKGRCN